MKRRRRRAFALILKRRRMIKWTCVGVLLGVFCVIDPSILTP
jgi:hypothetical protein